MAAEAIASVVLERLASVALNKLEEHFQLVMGAEGEVKKLTDSYRAIQALLYDAEIKKITDTNVNFWLQRFRDVAYEMDDIIDHWITETLISQVDNHTDGASSSSNNKTIHKNKKMVYSYFSSFCSCFGKVSLRHQTGLKIKELREKLEAIVSEKDALSLISNLPAANARPAGERLPTTSIIDVSEIFGRADDQNIILSKLLGDNNTTNPFIVSIIGMGGLGKTTLAQLVFEEARMKTYFDKVIWVSVSDFDETRIAKEIIRGAGVDVPKRLSEWNDELHQLLRDSVKKKRFLLVLDDMWMDDKEKWKPFRLAFKEAAPGSQILVTTRNQIVADAIDSNYRYPLGILSEENCWELFSHLAFHLQGKNANKKEIEEWKETGTSIAKKCKGIPLSAIVLGNLLRQKDEIKEWKTVMDNEFIWELENAENGILKPALMLSYYDLPPPERACFAYCAIFPKGYQIHKDELISLWMAQGLILSTGSGGKAVGNKYFNNLAARSFFQNFVKGWDGIITHCDMHDLVHDFAQFLTKGEYLTLADTSSDPPSQNPRHLTLFSENSFNPDSSLLSISNGEKNLRTLLLLSIPFQLKTILPDFLHHLRYLRVLIIQGSDLECLPTEIGKLIHLRYLRLRYNSYLTGLPDSLCSLYNLQTLDVSHCSSLRKLPEELGRMINLRCLRLEYTGSLECLPQGIGNLISLRSLTEFDVRISGGSNIKLLKDLDQLEGHLSILGLDRVMCSEDADEARLNNKKNLQSLLLNFAVINYAKQSEWKNPEVQFPDEHFEIAEVETVNHVLDSLKPPSLLEKLEIMNYRGSKFSNWIASVEKLSYLRNLVFDHCNCVELPALGTLRSLEHLSILRMHELKHIGPEFYGVDGSGHANSVAFPQLKTLRISKASVLEDWDDFTILTSMPLVREIELHKCIKLKALPAFGKLPLLEHLNISSLHNVKHIGNEFYGDGGGYAGGLPFPKLKKLRIEGARSLEKWDSSATLGMPCLRELELFGCNSLRVLPAFGKLPLLQYLNIDGLHSLKHIDHELHGDVGGHSVRVVFPMLERLRIEGAHMLDKWDPFAAVGAGPEGFDIIPCLCELEINDCGLRALPALGKLPSLKELKLIGLDKLKHIGPEFYGASGGEITNNVAFPQLETLEISFAEVLEEWFLGVEEKNNLVIVMPRLRKVRISWCSKLKILPALGRLQSLEDLSITKLDSLKQIGDEFYGIKGGPAPGHNAVSFPQLLYLHMEVNLEKWDYGMDAEQGDSSNFDANNVIMPRVRHIYIKDENLPMLPALGKLLSLETLTLKDLKNVSNLGPEFYGLLRKNRNTDDADVTTTAVPVFPKLHRLCLLGMKKLQQCDPLSRELEAEYIMPHLRELEISDCPKLYSLPQHLSNTLRFLSWEHSLSAHPPRLGQLEVLENFEMFMCGWSYLPQEIVHMRRLNTLVISVCQGLKWRYKDGADRNMISHIANVSFG